MDDSNPNTPEITCNNWLSKLSHGHIVSNSYVRPIVFLSSADSITFLPLKLGPKNGHSPIYFLFVNGNHGVLPEVEVKDGVKPIPPPFLAPKSTSKSAKGWLTLIKKGQDVYNEGLQANKIWCTLLLLLSWSPFYFLNLICLWLRKMANGNRITLPFYLSCDLSQWYWEIIWIFWFACTPRNANVLQILGVHQRALQLFLEWEDLHSTH